MTPDQQTLARALTELDGWRWSSGMWCEDQADGERWVVIAGPDDDRRYRWCSERGRVVEDYSMAILPDILDPATAGLVLQLVPAPWRVQTGVREGGTVYRVTSSADDGRTWDSGWRPTLGEAAARACIAAGRCA